MAPTAGQVAFYHLGEAFFNDEVFAAIGHARAQGLWTVVTSHLGLDRPGLARDIATPACTTCSSRATAPRRRSTATTCARGDVETVWRNLRRSARTASGWAAGRPTCA